MSDFIRELEEDIKEEELYKIWKKYRNYIVGAAVLIVAGSVSYPAYQSYQTSQSLKASQKYSYASRLVEKGEYAKAVPLFDEIIEGSTGYAKLASLQKAAAMTKIIENQGLITQMDDVEKIYTHLAEKNMRDPALSSLALIMEGYRKVALSEEGRWVGMVEPLTSPNHPWRGLALEVLALNDLKHGREAQAVERYRSVLEDKALASSPVYARSVLMLASLVEKVNN